ncbi:MAG: bifunctional folylpolyglutamate synthase/dihydrofolate synthase [Cytophagaceae bacterium]|jgi:dihydrofolate synthase/folylpolyglutamate synthase|nr:bifunctional folylpolyglutamate synthase/dihydrofolate synthase [Cytophagaceae bacterium]
MTYSEAITFLFEQLPMFQRTGVAAYKNNLNNTILLDEWLKHPHLRFKTIHVAGTNGKGSVSHILASIFQEAGYKTGLYTSPHLLDFRERIKVNGEMISQDAVTSFVVQNREIIEKISPSFFEMTVGMAFDYFAKTSVDVAIIETGLGGRLDSTNIISPELSIITNIGFDHTALLGNSLKAIASEKAGIIKQNTPVVIGELQDEIFPVFYEKAYLMDAPMYIADEVFKATVSDKNLKYQSFNIYKKEEFYIAALRLPLLGNYQRKNIQTVLKAVERLQASGFNIHLDHLQKGCVNVIKNTGLMGRWQILSEKPLTICDTGHNEPGIKEVVAQLSEIDCETLHFVLGVVNDKDLSGILKLLPADASYYFTRADLPRSLAAEKLHDEASQYGLKGIIVPNVKKAVAEAKKNAGDNDLIFIGGSTFIVAEALLF